MSQALGAALSLVNGHRVIPFHSDNIRAPTADVGTLPSCLWHSLLYPVGVYREHLRILFMGVCPGLKASWRFYSGKQSSTKALVDKYPSPPHTSWLENSGGIFYTVSQGPPAGLSSTGGAHRDHLCPSYPVLPLHSSIRASWD